MAKADKKFFLILDIDKVLAADELKVHAAHDHSSRETLTGEELSQ